MTCPHCRTVSSRFSDVCIGCGARLHAEVSEAVQLSLPLGPLPPELPRVENMAPVPYWQTDAGASAVRSTSPLAQNTSWVAALGNVDFQWNIPKLAFVLSCAALIGYSVHRNTMLNRNGVPVAAQQDPRSIVSPSTSTNTDTIQEIPSQDIPFVEDPFPSPAFFDSLQTANEYYLPPSTLKPQSLNSALKLRYLRPVPETTRSEITGVYTYWKKLQQEDSSRIENFINLYEPSAQIFYAPDQELSRSEFSNLTLEMRETGLFASASDQKPIQWGQNASGDQVELLAYHLYREDGGNKIWGQRRLTWKKRGNQWFIIRDDFPPHYLTLPRPPFIKNPPRKTGVSERPHEKPGVGRPATSGFGNQDSKFGF